MAEAKITIGGRALTEGQSEIIRIAVDRWSYDENVDVGSEDHARVRELKAMIDGARGGEGQSEVIVGSGDLR